MPKRQTAVLISLLIPVLSCTQIRTLAQSKAWQVDGAQAWMEDQFVRMVPHPTYGQIGLTAGNFLKDSADKRAVFVQITFRSVGNDPGATDAWKKRMPGFMKSYKLPEVPAGTYRFFDSERVLLGTAKPKVIETYPEKWLLSMSGSDLVMVGESPSPKGFVGTFVFGGGSEL